MSDVAPDLLMRLLIDQSERWNRGDPLRVESYLEQHPSLLAGDEPLLDLISNEIYVRQLRGDAPAVEEYRNRFPRLAEQIELQFRLHQAAGSAIHNGSSDSLLAPSRQRPTSAREQMPSIPGYEVIEEIGRGAMGIVFKARQKSLRRIVALKIKDRATLQPRFRAEAESVARLQHTNIVQIFEIGALENCSYFSLELVEGGSLAQRLKSSVFRGREAAQCIRTLAQAIHYAHQQGVVHRDLKPANILLTTDGTPKITDFGLAKQLTGNQRLTQIGDILGTPSYMAPEQALGTSKVGEAADIYSLGAILYELLTGQPPFRGETAYATLLLVGTEQPLNPAAIRPGVSADLNAICLKCLNKKPRLRYSSAQALADDLDRFLDGRPVEARPVDHGTRLLKWACRSPARLGLGVAIVVALMVIVAEAAYYGVRLQREQQSLEQERARLADEADAVRTEAAGIATQRNQALAANRLLEIQRDAAEERLRVAEAERNALREEAAALTARISTVENTANDKLRIEAKSRQKEIQDRLDRAGRDLYALQLEGVATTWSTDPDRARQLLRDASRCPPELREFTWHLFDAACQRARTSFDVRNQVLHAVAVAPDGKTFATAADDGIVYVRSVDNGNVLHTLSKHQGPVYAVAYALKGKLLATAGKDHIVHVWDAASGKHLRAHNGKHVIHALAFSPNGKVLAYAGDGGTIRLTDPLSDKDTVETKKLHVGPIRALAFSPDGKTLASAGDDAVIKFWDDKTANLLGLRDGHRGPIHALAYSPDRKHLASAGIDGSPMLWNVSAGTAKFVLTGHTGPVTSVAFSSDSRTLATAAQDSALAAGEPEGSVRLWDVSSGRAQASLFSTAGLISIGFLSDGKRLVAASAKNLEIWQTAPTLERASNIYTDASSVSLDMSPNGKTIAVLGDDKLIKLYDPVTTASISLKGRHDRVACALFRPDNKGLVSGGMDGALSFWELPEGKLRQEVQAHAGGTTCLAISPNGAHLASGGEDHLIKLWNPTNGEAIATLQEHSADIKALAFSADGEMLASASSDGGLKLWRIPSGEPIRTLQFLGDPIETVALLPDGAALAAGGRGGIVDIWDVASGKLTRTLPGHRGGVLCLATSPDGKTLAVGAGAAKNIDPTRTLGEVRLWDPVGGQLRAVLTGHPKPVTAIRFGENGRIMISISKDGMMKMWDAQSP